MAVNKEHEKHQRGEERQCEPSVPHSHADERNDGEELLVTETFGSLCLFHPRPSMVSSLATATRILFFFTWAAHGITEWQVFTDEQAAHGETAKIGDFIAEFFSRR